MGNNGVKTSDDPSPGTHALVIATSTLPIHDGDGVPRFVLDLATALSKRYQVTLVAPYSRGSVRAESIGQVSVVRFRYFWPRRLHRLSDGGVVAVNLAASWLARLQVPFLIVAQTLAIRREVKKTGAKVVNAHWLIPQGLSATIACRLTGAKHVAHIHAGDVYFLKRVPLGGAITRFIMHRTEASFADGSHVSSALDELLGANVGTRIRPMGVWADEFRDTDLGRPIEGPYVVFVGRFVEKKGVTYLLRAMTRVREARPDVSLVLIGTGPLEADLKQQVEALGLGKSVLFTGPLSHEMVIGHLKNTAVACVPSIIDSRGETEGMPTVVIEAMAAGARVVGTDVNGIPDVLRDQGNGWLAQPADPDDLARCLLEALESPRGDAVAHEAWITAQAHDWAHVAAQYASVIDAVANEA